MPVYTIQAPDGRKVKIEAKDEATAMRGAKEWYASQRPNTAKDVAKSYGTGVGQGAASMAGMRGDVAEMRRRMAPVVDNPLSRAIAAGTAVADRFMFGPTSNALGRAFNYEPQTEAGKVARTAGQMTPNALAPGGPVSRVASVLLPTAGSEGLGRLADNYTDNALVRQGARVVGAVAGGLASGLRVGRRPQATVDQRAAQKMAAQARQDPAQMQARVAERRAAGLQPTMTDAVDEAGRGVVRAAASRMTPARTRAQGFAEQRAVDLPRRMSTQARNHLSPDSRTPREIGGELARNRGAQANQQYGAVRNDVIDMPPQTVQALRTEFGREAIREAARGERDPNIRAALNRLADAALDDPSTQITVGMADSISRALYGQARGTTNPNLRSILTGLADDVRNPARQASPGYGQAVDDFAQESRLIEAAERGEDYLARDTDNFVADVQSYGPEGLPVARATARRAIERASGENVSAAPGVARRIATAPEVQARTRALLPEQEAQAFERAMALEEEAVQSARYIAPNTGSPTQGRGQDAAQVAGEVAELGAGVTSMNPVATFIAGAKLFLRGQRLSDREAEALVNMAIDPARTDEALRLLTTRLGPQRAQAFLRALQRGTPPALLAGGAAGSQEQ